MRASPTFAMTAASISPSALSFAESSAPGIRRTALRSGSVASENSAAAARNAAM